MPRYRLLGVVVDAITPHQVFEAMTTAIAGGQKRLFANHNLNSVHLIRRDPVMQQFFARADLIQIDGMPIIAWGRLLGADLGRQHRSTFLDWWQDIFAMAAARGWRVYYIGSAPGVAATAADRLRQAYPGLQIATRDGFFDATPGSADHSAVLSEITAFAPHILMVGMGMPRQERWIIQNYDTLPPAVVLNVGAAFDYIAGIVPTPPRWTGRWGLEWAWRLAAEPKRLFKRYLIDPWSLLPLVLADLWRRLRAGPLRPEPSPPQPHADAAP